MVASIESETIVEHATSDAAECQPSDTKCSFNGTFIVKREFFVGLRMERGWLGT